MAEDPDSRGQYFLTCQLCKHNVQFYCAPCKIRLCVKCVSMHLETNAPDHNIVYYHKQFGTKTKSLHDPQIIRTIPCGYHRMSCIRYADSSQNYVSSHLSSEIKLVCACGTLITTFSLEILPMFLTPFEDGVLYTGTGGIRKINSQGDQLFLPIKGELKGIKFVEPNIIFVCNSCMVEKYTTGGERLLSIQLKDQGQDHYRTPQNISINGNGDICVAKYNAARAHDPDPVVTVVDQTGKYRFSYRPVPSFQPMDLCCDSCLHIIIASITIHIIDKDGNFLRYLMYDGIDKPWSVTIDSEDNLFVSQMNDKYLRMIKYLY